MVAHPLAHHLYHVGLDLDPDWPHLHTHYTHYTQGQTAPSSPKTPTRNCSAARKKVPIPYLSYLPGHPSFPGWKTERDFVFSCSWPCFGLLCVLWPRIVMDFRSLCATRLRPPRHVTVIVVVTDHHRCVVWEYPFVRGQWILPPTSVSTPPGWLDIGSSSSIAG